MTLVSLSSKLLPAGGGVKREARQSGSDGWRGGVGKNANGIIGAMAASAQKRRIPEAASRGGASADAADAAEKLRALEDAAQRSWAA